MRGRPTPVLLQWHPGLDSRPMPGAAGDLELAAHQEHALSHAGMAKASPVPASRRVEPDPVVDDHELETAVQPLEANRGPAGLRVTPGVAERLLRNSEQAERHIVRQF